MSADPGAPATPAAPRSDLTPHEPTRAWLLGKVLTLESLERQFAAPPAELREAAEHNDDARYFLEVAAAAGAMLSTTVAFLRLGVRVSDLPEGRP